MISRGHMLRLMTSVVLLAGCRSHSSGTILVGSEPSGQSALIADIYASALQRARIAVERRTNYDDAPALLAALLRGEIDLYPEYVNARSGRRDDSEAARVVGDIARLDSSPMQSAPCVVTTQFVAEQYWLLDLSTCAKIAPRLTFGATADFLEPTGTLHALRRFYGGFKFKSVITVDPAAPYDPLKRGDVDVTSGFTTDPQISEADLVILRDDKMALRPHTYAPAARLAALRAHPTMHRLLNDVSKKITTFAVQQMTAHIDLLHVDPSEEADQFIRDVGATF